MNNEQEYHEVCELWLCIPGDPDVGMSEIVTIMALPSQLSLTMLQLRSLCHSIQNALNEHDKDIYVTSPAIEKAEIEAERLIFDDFAMPPDIEFDPNVDGDAVANDIAFDAHREKSIFA